MDTVEHNQKPRRFLRNVRFLYLTFFILLAFIAFAFRYTVTLQPIIFVLFIAITGVGALIFRRLKEAEDERHRTEVAEESNRAKSRFLARMSHEIRTPITAVIGISEIELQNSDLSENMASSLSKIHTSANSLLTIANDILDLSKIETGKMELFREEYCVTSLINDINNLHPYFSGNKEEVEFRLHISANIPSHLFGDASRIGQIVHNLLASAFKHTDAGSVELFWGAECTGDPVNLLISVRDTGCGISEEQIAILQNGEYARLHKNEDRFADDTGLGLFIIYNLLKLMNADTEIKSVVGVGTTIVVRIPQNSTENSLPIGKETAERLQGVQSDERFASKKFSFELEPMPYGSVLLVDDVEANLFVAKGLLAFYDLNIETCTSGYDAIEKISADKKYDLIFMDYMMPGMDGIETMETMRKMGYNEPIVAFTANALIGNAERFVSAGFDGFIPKPINSKQLNDTLTKFIRNKQPAEIIKAAKLTRKVSSDELNHFQSDGAILDKLRTDFTRQRKNAITELNDAFNAGDLKQANFIAHTLKGSASLIYETELADAAGALEKLFNDGEFPPQSMMTALEEEFTRVIRSIKSTIEPPTYRDEPNRVAALEILNSLESMLTLRKAQSINALGELRNIPEAAVFVRQVENFDFAAALTVLPVLRDILDE
ncbi:MAG: response regulator [Defluviitaleaceae bacterium]|nr:response regulator [Defluviitaleaceae bacterium]